MKLKTYQKKYTVEIFIVVMINILDILNLDLIVFYT